MKKVTCVTSSFFKKGFSTYFLFKNNFFKKYVFTLKLSKLDALDFTLKKMYKKSPKKIIQK